MSLCIGAALRHVMSILKKADSHLWAVTTTRSAPEMPLPTYRCSTRSRIVAFPLIGTGAFGWPRQDAIAVAIETIATVRGHAWYMQSWRVHTL